MAVTQDNCTEEQNLVIAQVPPPGTVISGHNTTETITISVTDGSGNTEECTFTVTAKDETQPVIICPGDQVVNPDANCDALIPDYRNSAKVTDNCADPGAISVTQRPAPGTVLNGEGDATQITLVADDGNGNLDSCTFIVTLEDNVPPTISCPDDKTVDLNENCAYDLEDLTVQITCPADQVVFVDAGCDALVPDYRDATVEDNCTDPTDITVTQVLAPGTMLSGHATTETITLTADDGFGNTSSCSFQLTLQDNTPPTIACPPAQQIDSGDDCGFTLPDYRSLATQDDNCGAGTLTVVQSPSPDSIINGLNVTTEVVLTVMDVAGNSTSCTFTTTTVSPTPPPAQATVMLAVTNPPTGTGTVDLRDAFDNMAVSNLSNIDLDGMLDPDSDPFLVTYYLTMADADAETGGISPENYNPTINGTTVLVRIEAPATGCFVISQILIEVREPGVSDAEDVVQCNRPGTVVKIDGLPVPGGMGTAIVQHQWRIVSPGTTRITDADLMQADQQLIMINTDGLRSGTVILE